LVFPSAESPAVRANGTVKPSERPTGRPKLANSSIDS